MIEKKSQRLMEAKDTESVERKPWHHSAELASGALGGLLAFLLRFLSLTPSPLLYSANNQAVLVLIMSQADLALHALVCISFLALTLACRNDRRKRFITTSAVNFMMGILIGSFLAWNVVDMLLGFPLQSAARFLSLLIMLTQCWMINRCYGTLATAENETDASDCEYAIATNQEECIV